MRLLLGECLEHLKAMPSGGIEAVVTDPPAGIGFMGKKWDQFKTAAEFVAYMSPILAECLRCLKPGGHALVWALPRTSHWTGAAIEQAGFEPRDVICHHFGNGFPKGLDVSKAIDKAAGAERHVVGRYELPDVAEGRRKPWECSNTTTPGMFGATSQPSITAPATEDAKKWEGWGTALKPATEFWWLCRKPLEGSVQENVLEHGTGALNIDGCRIPGGKSPSIARRQGAPLKIGAVWRSSPGEWAKFHPGEQLGRWPANLMLSHSPDCGEKCVEGCPIKALDEQAGPRPCGGLVRSRRTSTKFSGNVYGAFKGQLVCATIPPSTGPASRFFYTAKASGRERNAGLDEFPRSVAPVTLKALAINFSANGGGACAFAPRANTHPTVKSITLMRYLCRLITPPGGTVLDPFMGSGSTGVACIQEGFDFIGIEREPEYFAIAEARIKHAQKQGRLFEPEAPSLGYGAA